MSDLPGTQSSHGRSATSYNRRRASNACLVCRSRKTKCDNQRPRCSFCISNGGDCRYVDTDPSQLDRSTLTILERISQLETSLIMHIDSTLKEKVSLPANNHFLGEQGDMQDYASQTQEHMDVSRPFEDQTTGSASWGPPAGSGIVQNTTNPGTPAVVPSDDAPPSTEVLLRASEMSIESILKWSVFSEAAPHLVAALETPLIEVVDRPRPNNLGQSSSALPDLSPDTINRLVQNFLNNNHIKNPVLDVQSLWADAREFAESGPQWDARSCLLVRLLHRKMIDI
jgi:Fungal Zn(2)-Cys(6) binuclear cluster domain